MIWLLLLLMVSSAFAVFESLLELVGIVLFLLHLTIENVAGKQAAAVFSILVIGVGVGCAVWFFNTSSDHGAPTSVDTARYAETSPLASSRSSTPSRSHKHRANTSRANTPRVRSACGTGAAPQSIDAEVWTHYRCRISDDAGACLPWNEYTPHAQRGCPRVQLCCPPSSIEEHAGADAAAESGTDVGAPADSPDSTASDPE